MEENEVVEPTEEEVAPVSEEGEPAEVPEEEVAEEEAEPAEEPPGPQKKTAQERIQQLIEERNADRAKLDALEAKLQERLAQEEAQKKPFVEVQKERFDAYVAQAMERIDELKIDGKYVEALELQEHLFTIRKEWNENEQKKQEWQKKQQEQTYSQQTIQQNAHNVEVAARLYREHSGIDEKAWIAGMDVFNAEAKKNPIVGTKFRELVEKRGAMEAVEFAHKVVLEATKPHQETVAKKEAAKAKVPSATGGKVATPSTKLNDPNLSMAEWVKLREQAS